MRKNTFLLFAVFLFGLILRSFHLSSTMQFGGDEGWGYLVARDAILNHALPILGPPTSLGWLRLGPFVYYLLIAVLKVGNFHPLSFGVFTSVLDAISTVLIFFISKIYISKKNSLLVSLMYASSPFMVFTSRIPLYVYITSFFSLLFYFFWLSFIKSRKRNLFRLSFFAFGILLQTHITPILLLPVYLITIYKKISKKELFKGIMFFLLPLIPLIYSEILTRFQMFLKIVLWFPYRILGFFGFLSEKNIITSQKIGNIFEITVKTLTQTVFMDSSLLSILLVFFVLVWLLYRRNYLFFSILTFSLLGVIIHGQPASHYFVFMLPILILSLGLFLTSRKIGIPVAIAIILINAYSISKFYSGNSSFLDQMNLVKKMIELSANNSYSIVPTPDIVDLPHLYDGYRYLSWWLGKEPVKTASINFEIYEKEVPSYMLTGKVQIYSYGRLTLIKL